MSLHEAAEAVIPSVLTDLKRLIAIPSVSSISEHDDDVLAAADVVAHLLRDVGCPTVELLEVPGGKPAVYGHFPAPEGAPTVLLYAHYDVQPTGDPDAWTSPAFAPSERDSRLYARGAADDKGGIAVHLSALRAFEGKPPIGVKVFIEGEEEIGSPSMEGLFEKFGDRLHADVFVIADAVNWKVGEPSLTATLRGSVDAVVTVSTLQTGLHSGQFGGVVPDALTALCRLLATLHDEAGNVAIEGLKTSPEPTVEYDEDRLREETGILEGVEWIGDGSAASRMWAKPSASVLAIDTTRLKDASNTLIPSAKAKVSVRIAPGDDPVSATKALVDHLHSHAPWGAHVDVQPGRHGSGSEFTLSGELNEKVQSAFREAFGLEAVAIGTGGSIPIAAEFAERNPGAAVLLTAVVDPTSRMHGIDESVDLGDLAKAVVAETLLLQNLA